MGAAWVALSFPEADSRFLIFGMGAMAMLGGAAWAFIPAILKVRFRANEILVSLMLTYIAALSH